MEKAWAPVKAACPRGARGSSRTAMNRRDEERERRLAAALRDNLKRRKAQARAEPATRADPECPEPTPEPERP
jgi:hypothetical protein